MSNDTVSFFGANPVTVSGYLIFDEATNSGFPCAKKPKWFHRVMMRLFFGIKWVDYGKM